MMHSAAIKFLGSDYNFVNECFIIGKSYHADVSSACNYLIVDEVGDTWCIDPDDNDFEVME